jgi:hypothetical protein
MKYMSIEKDTLQNMVTQNSSVITETTFNSHDRENIHHNHKSLSRPPNLLYYYRRVVRYIRTLEVSQWTAAPAAAGSLPPLPAQKVHPPTEPAPYP